MIDIVFASNNKGKYDELVNDFSAARDQFNISSNRC